jgi:hypothetical protein
LKKPTKIRFEDYKELMRRDDPTFDAIMLPDLMKLGMFDDCEWEGD